MKEWRTQDDGGIQYTNISRQRQKECLDFIDEQALHEPAWLIEPAYVGSLAPDTQTLLMPVARNIVGRLTDYDLLAGMNADYPAPDYLADLTQKVFAELASGGAVSRYRRSLQQLYATALIDAFNRSSASAYSSLRPAVLMTLKDLEKQLAAAKSADAQTSAHYLSLADTIHRALEVK